MTLDQAPVPKVHIGDDKISEESSILGENCSRSSEEIKNEHSQKPPLAQPVVRRKTLTMSMGESSGSEG